MSRAAVRVDGTTVGAIDRGLVVFLAVERGDGPDASDALAAKTAELRVFPDEDGKMNRSVEQVSGGVLVVSQFTLAARARRGRRPSFAGAAPPEEAIPLYERFVRTLGERGLRVATGTFRAMMEVELVGDGPVTILLDTRERSEA